MTHQLIPRIFQDTQIPEISTRKPEEQYAHKNY
jgi:hypothetical protein